VITGTDGSMSIHSEKLSGAYSNDGSGFRNMKWLTRYIAVAVILLLHAGHTASGEQARSVDEEIKATWTSVLDGHLNDAIARATKLLSGSTRPRTEKHIGVQAPP
jgi:hypothetical protein